MKYPSKQYAIFRQPVEKLHIVCLGILFSAILYIEVKEHQMAEVSWNFWNNLNE